jgi:hypothetical protein
MCGASLSQCCAGAGALALNAVVCLFSVVLELFWCCTCIETCLVRLERLAAHLESIAAGVPALDSDESIPSLEEAPPPPPPPSDERPLCEAANCMACREDVDNASLPDSHLTFDATLGVVDLGTLRRRRRKPGASSTAADAAAAAAAAHDRDT